MKRITKRRLRVGGMGVIAAISLLAWVSLPVGAIWWLSIQTQAAEVAPTQTTWVPIQPHSGPLSREASLYMEWSDLAPVVAPQWSGTVTANQLTVGATISSGQNLLAIDGVQRVGFSSQQPFYRPLEIGSEGTDLSELRSLLTTRGLSAADTDSLTWDDLYAIREFAASIGVPDADYITAFDPSWIVFLPSTTAMVSKSLLAVGSPAPAAGESIAELAPQLASARLVQRVETVESDDATPVDPATLVQLTKQPEEQVIVGGEEATVSDDMTTLDSEGLKVLLAVAKLGAPLVSANLVSSTRGDLWVVPAASLLTDQSGTSCVVTNDGTKSRQPKVTVVTSEGSNAIVSGDLSIDDAVALNARVGTSACR